MQNTFSSLVPKVNSCDWICQCLEMTINVQFTWNMAEEREEDKDGKASFHLVAFTGFRRLPILCPNPMHAFIIPLSISAQRQLTTSGPLEPIYWTHSSLQLQNKAWCVAIPLCNPRVGALGKNFFSFSPSLLPGLVGKCPKNVLR